MPTVYKTPGVYREEIFLKPEVSLPTGVPGFIGFFTARTPEADVSANSVISLNRKEEFTDKFVGLPGGYLLDAIIGFFENGGTHCYVVRADYDDQNNGHNESALKNALESLVPLSDLDLVAIPDAMVLQDSEATIRVQQAVLKHCETQGNRLAILDSLPGSNTDLVLDQRNQLMAVQKEPLNGTLYYPWLRNTEDRLVPPSGHVAGIFARSDRSRGVFKAPANEELRGVLGLEVAVENSVQDQLNPKGINCLRTFPGRGTRVWGARTLSQDLNWRYVNVRRLFLTLNRWIDQNMGWATFEPHSPQLWIRIQRELNSYLSQLWREGALQGQTAEQAFYIKCDAETNPPDNRQTGQVITEIGLAVNGPAEFLVIRILHRSSTTDVRV